MKNNIKYYEELIRQLRALNPNVPIEDDLEGLYPHVIFLPAGTILVVPDGFCYNEDNGIIIEEDGNCQSRNLDVYTL